VSHQRIFVALIAYASMALVACGLGTWLGRPFPVRHPAPWWDLGSCAEVVSIGLGLGVALVTVLSTRWLLARTAWARALRRELRTLLEGATGRQLVLLGVFSGIAEELLFRGAIQPVAGLTLTSIGFGLLHVGRSRAFLPWTIWAIAMGFVLGGIFEATGVLAGPILAHVLINAVNLRTIVFHDARLDEGDGRPPAPRLVTRVRRDQCLLQGKG
jgi:membrane protease YdiL (CAAX protease family)